MKPFKYGDFEKHVDLTDYTVLDRVIKAEAEYQQTVNRITEEEDVIKSLKTSVIAMTDMLDAVLGDNASNEILGDSITSLAQVTNVYVALDSFINNQTKEVTKQIQEARSKYSPKGD